MRRPSWGLVAALALSGCALLGKSEPLVPRYYAPADGAAAPPTALHPGLQLRLGRIEGGSHLRERMVVRRSSQELAYREDRRWTERPEVYLRRALDRALFEERGVVQALSGRAVALDVELVAFEEVETPHLARLQVRLVLRDERLALLAETVTVERPIEGPLGGGPQAVVEALSWALRQAATQVADQVVARLAELPPRPAPGAPAGSGGLDPSAGASAGR